MSIQTPLAKAKGLGSAREGAHQWWTLRVTSFALIPLVAWFIYTVVCSVVHQLSPFAMLKSPIHATLMVLFLGMALHHGAGGMREIIEDYVSAPCKKHCLILLTNGAALLFGIISILAVVTAHISGGV